MAVSPLPGPNVPAIPRPRSYAVRGAGRPPCARVGGKLFHLAMLPYALSEPVHRPWPAEPRLPVPARQRILTPAGPIHTAGAGQCPTETAR
jgi:hypothetical protein